MNLVREFSVYLQKVSEATEDAKRTESQTCAGFHPKFKIQQTKLLLIGTEKNKSKKTNKQTHKYEIYK